MFTEFNAVTKWSIMECLLHYESLEYVAYTRTAMKGKKVIFVFMILICVQ